MRDNYIHINSGTLCRGAVYAHIVIVAGMVDGEIIANERVLIKNGGFVNGPIQAQKILMEEGARHEGTITLFDADGANKEPHKETDPSSQKNRKSTEKKPQKSAAGKDKRLW